MGVLTNQRHERFAQELAKGKSTLEAYELAGYEPNRGNATTLKANESILNRVVELQQTQWDKAELDRNWVIERLKTIETKAFEKGQYGNAKSCVELIGKDMGMFRDSERAANVTVNLESKPDFAQALGSASNAAHTQEQGSKADPTKH